jgi:hypothetical protein
MAMKRILYVSLVAMAAIAAFQTRSDAQILSRGDLFGPGAPPPMVGIEFGLGKHQQQGTFDADCGCTFENGTGTGFLGNLLFELPLDYEWALGIKAGIDFKNTTSRRAVFDTAVIEFPEEESDTVSALGFDRVGDVKATYLNFSPFVQYQFFRMGPFLQAGVGIGLLVANHFTHHRELGSTEGKLLDGRTIPDLRFKSTGTLEETMQDGEISDVNKLRLGIALSAGYNVGVTERSVLTPMLTYDLPLSTLKDKQASGWKIGSLYASAVLKFKLD